MCPVSALRERVQQCTGQNMPFPWSLVNHQWWSQKASDLLVFRDGSAMLPMQPQLDIEASTLATQPVNSSSSDFSCLFQVQRLPTGPVVKIHLQLRMCCRIGKLMQVSPFCCRMLSHSVLLLPVIQFSTADNAIYLSIKKRGGTVLVGKVLPLSVTRLFFLLQWVSFGKPFFLCWLLMKDLALDTHIPQWGQATKPEVRWSTDRL